MSVGLSLIKNMPTPLTKNILLPLWVTAAASATDAAIQKKIYGSGITFSVNISQLDDTMKIVKSFEDATLLIKVVSETVESEVKEQRRVFLGLLAATLGASLVGNMLEGRGMKSKIPERETKIPGLGVILAGEGTTRADEGTIKSGLDF